MNTDTLTSRLEALQSVAGNGREIEELHAQIEALERDPGHRVDAALKAVDSRRQLWRDGNAGRCELGDEIARQLYEEFGCLVDDVDRRIEDEDGEEEDRWVDPRVQWTAVAGGQVSTVRSPSGIFETALLRDGEDGIELEKRFGDDEAAVLRYHDELVASLTPTAKADPPTDPHPTTATAAPSSAAPRPTEPPGSSATTTAATDAPAGSLRGPVGHHPAAFFFCLGVLSTLAPFNANAPGKASKELRIAEHRVYVAPQSAAQEWLRRTAAAFSKAF